MSEFYAKNKKLCNILLAVLASVILTVYLFALLRPGMWHRDAFLHRQADGSYAGWDIYGKYAMEISRSDHGADISFTVNGDTKNYGIVIDSKSSAVKISENGENIFDGNVIIVGDSYILKERGGDISDIITVRAGNYVPTNDELFPSCTKLYNWSVAVKDDTRGEPMMLLLILFIAALLALDIIFPDLFFTLRHFLSVDGGTPSALYRFGQVLGRIAMVIAIIAAVFMSFRPQ